MGQVKIKFGEIRETLDNFDICEDDKEIIDELLNLEKRLRYVHEHAKFLDQYGDDTRKNIRTVMRTNEEISRLFELSAINPPEKLDKKIVKLANKVCTKANMINDALDIIKSMTNLEKDPVWEIVQMIYHAEFNNDADKLKKLIKRYVLKVIAESPEKVDIDYDKLLDEDVDDEERGESCTPVTVDVVVGIRDVCLNAGNPKNIHLNDGIIKAEVMTNGKKSFLQITQIKDQDKTNTYQLAIRRRPTGGSTVEKQIVIAENLSLFINEVMDLSYCNAVDINILIDKYGLDKKVLTAEPKDDQNSFFKNADRLAIYVEILVDGNGVFQYAYANTFNSYSRAVDISYNQPDTHYLHYTTSEVEDFESAFDSVRLFGNMKALPEDKE